MKQVAKAISDEPYPPPRPFFLKFLLDNNNNPGSAHVHV